MALDTYVNLQASVITWAMRDGDTGFATAVPDFIALCEQVINYGADGIPALRVADMETTVTLTPTSGVCALPADYLEWRALKGNSTSCSADLKMAPPDWLNSQYPLGAANAIAPYFSISGSSLTSYQSPTATVTLTYYAKVPPLASNSTNWLLTRASGVYLYGSLAQSGAFMMDPKLLQLWGSNFKAAMAGVQSADMGARYARSTARVRGQTP